MIKFICECICFTGYIKLGKQIEISSAMQNNCILKCSMDAAVNFSILFFCLFCSFAPKAIIFLVVVRKRKEKNFSVRSIFAEHETLIMTSLIAAINIHKTIKFHFSVCVLCINITFFYELTFFSVFTFDEIFSTFFPAHRLILTITFFSC